MRNERYEVTLLTLDGGFDRTLHFAKGGDVTANRSADIVRTASLDVHDRNVPWETSLVRVTYYCDEFTIPLITGFPSVGDDTYKSGVASTRIQVFDTTDALKSSRTQMAFGVAKGTNIVARVKELIANATPLTSVAIEPSSATLATDIVWELSTPWLSIVNDLLAAAGFTRLYADGFGTLRADPLVSDSSKPVAQAFRNDATSLIENSGVQLRTNRADVPNRLRGVRTMDSPGQPADVYIATNTDPASPFSYAGRGYRWIDGEVYADVAASSYEVFKTLVEEELARRSRIAASFEFNHPVLQYDVGDVVTFRHSSLTPGGEIRCSTEELRYTLTPGAMVRGRYTS